MSQIKATEYPLSKILSSDFDYNIPSYQRPYSWDESEADQLFDDLLDFYQNESKEESYFLGSIVLIKKENERYSEVIDGQQRLTTLTILFSVIADSLTDIENKNEFKEYVNERGNRSQNIAPQPRLKLRERDNRFFKKYIQDFEIDELLKLNPEIQKKKKDGSEAQANIIQNAKLLKNKISESFNNEDEIFEFGSFVINRCYLVVVSTPVHESAFRIFSVLNSRGMPLLPTDIIKSDIIGKINDEDYKYYAEKWEEMENQLGRDKFCDLFGHIRMINMKSKAKKSLNDEFRESVLKDINDNKTAIEFIDNTLEPYVEAYNVIKNLSYSLTKKADEVNDILRWLNQIDNSDWLPVAILFYKKHDKEPEHLEVFFKKLERLASYMRIKSFSLNKRIERYADVLSDIENSDDINVYGEKIELSVQEQNEFIDALNSDIYERNSNERKYLILRLDSFMVENAAIYKNDKVSIEHVLPQTPSNDSKWKQVWNDEERNYWLHKIGNLVPLTKSMNSKARNFEFDVKKDKYFTDENGASSFWLTKQIQDYKEWTPEIVAARQKYLIDNYKKGWNLTEAVDIEKNSEIIVSATIATNDIKLKRLYIPVDIRNRIPTTVNSYSVTFNNELTQELLMHKSKMHFSGMGEIYKMFGLIDENNNFVPKKITWKMKPDGSLFAEIEQ